MRTYFIEEWIRQVDILVTNLANLNRFAFHSLISTEYIISAELLINIPTLQLVYHSVISFILINTTSLSISVLWTHIYFCLQSKGTLMNLRLLYIIFEWAFQWVNTHSVELNENFYVVIVGSKMSVFFFSSSLSILI